MNEHLIDNEQDNIKNSDEKIINEVEENEEKPKEENKEQKEVKSEIKETEDKSDIKEKGDKSEIREKEIKNEIKEKEEKKKENKEEEIIYKETPFRFCVVIAYCLLSFANAVGWVTYSSTAENYKDAYHLTSNQVNMFGLIYMILYPIVCIPEAYIVDNVSTYLGLSLSSFTTLLGSLLKAFPNKLYLAYIGQIFCSIFQPVILNSPAKISAVWFKDENRAKVTTICVVSNNLGVMFGIIFHTFFIDDDSEEEKYKSQFEKYVLAEFILTALFCIPTFFLVRDKPKIPVSPSQNNYIAPPLKTSIKLLFSNKNFIILLICFTCVIGVWNMYGTIFNPYMAKYDISDSRAAIISSIANFVSIFFAMVGSYILDKTKKFRFILLICNLSAFVIMVIFTLLLEFVKNLDIVFGLSILLYSSLVGFLITIHTNGMDYVCELTYPVGESQSGGIIMSMNQIFGICLTYLGQFFIDEIKKQKFITNILTCTTLLISLVTLWFIEDKLLRHEKENEGKLITV